ncbi:MAG: GxxExxY protein [Saprospiraceae bacterium]
MKHTDLSTKIIGAAIEVHTTLGPGLFENVYKECLAYKLSKLGMRVVKEFPIPLTYEEIKLECGYRADILVENEIIIEIKSIERLAPIHFLHL